MTTPEQDWTEREASCGHPWDNERGFHSCMLHPGHAIGQHRCRCDETIGLSKLEENYDVVKLYPCRCGKDMGATPNELHDCCLQEGME